MRLRVATYNVRSFRAGMRTVAEVLGPLRPDLVLVQEAALRPMLRRFAAHLEMGSVSSHRLFHRVRNAVLYRAPWRVTGFEVVDFPPQARLYRRGFIAAHLVLGQVRLTALCTHLGLAPRERLRHAREITRFLGRARGHAILAGDLNEGPEGEATRWIAARLRDAFASAGEGGGETLPARAPTARIDFIFSSDGLTPVRAWVPDGEKARSASDHLPVVADFEVAEA